MCNHMNPEELQAALHTHHGNVTAVAAEAGRSTAAVRRQMVKLLGYRPRPASRPRRGLANPFFGKRHSEETKRKISAHVRDTRYNRLGTGSR